jgi:S1-C subfamily serine protease
MGFFRAALCLVTAVGASTLVLQADAAPAEVGLAEVVARVKPSVVAVGTYQKNRSPPFVFRGTGFVVGDGTLIATAAHVVAETLSTENRETMMILMQAAGTLGAQGREAKSIAVDKTHDVALLRIGGNPLPIVELGDADAVRDGQSVAFTGFPIGTALGFYPATHRGIVAAHTPVVLPSANAARLDSRVIHGLKEGPFVLFQLDATAFPGHSGSPLYDAATGEVVGIVNMGAVKGMKDSAIGQPSGLSFAVPIQHLRELMRTVR